MPPQPKLVDRALISLKLKKPGGGLTRDQALQAWPVRNPALKSQVSDEGLVTVELPRRKDAIGGVLGFLFSVPDSKPVELDEVGSFVWNRCDGDHTVKEIVSALVEEYKLNRREVEVSLNQYLQQLAKRGIIAFAVPREIAEAAGLSGPEVPAQPEPTTTPVDEPAEPVSDFHPGLLPQPSPPPHKDDTSDFPPVNVEDVLEIRPLAEPLTDEPSPQPSAGEPRAQEPSPDEPPSEEPSPPAPPS